MFRFQNKAEGHNCSAHTPSKGLTRTALPHHHEAPKSFNISINKGEFEFMKFL
jgi:hypothetical protein